MKQGVVFIFLLGSIWIGTESTIQLPTLPPISTVVNRITNTTFDVLGVVRGGLNLISNTFERILDSTLSISDKIRELLEEFRKYMAIGIAELGVPILEPLKVDRVDMNVTHEALSLAGSIENVRIRQLSKFTLDYIHANILLKVSLNMTFPNIEVDGKYDMNGVIGDLFAIFGKGPFWLKMHQFKIAMVAQLRYNNTRNIFQGIYVESLNLDIKLKEMENNFQNLMKDKELGGIFNRAISSLAPEAVDILWPEMKEEVQNQLIFFINEKLQEMRLSNILGRLFNNVLRVGR